MSKKTRFLLFAVLIAAAFIIRLLPALSALDFPERFIRPDTPTYLEPARALLEGGSMGTGRAPGYILLAAGIKWLSGQYHHLFLALAGVFLSIFTIFPVYGGAKELFGKNAGLAAAFLYGFNLTVTANAPMLLSDTFFGLFAAFQFFFFSRFFRKKKGTDFLLCIFFAAAGTLIRPINLPWIFPALVLLWFCKGVPFRSKVLHSAGALLITLAIILPWMARNASVGAPWCIDTNTGAMVHQNGAMILAEVRRTNYEDEKQKIIREYDALFLDKKKFPDEKSREEWKMKRFRKIIAAHPLTALKQHFNWHRILLPDAPTFFEILGFTKSDRGTMNVLVSKGFFAAVDHYFEGRWLLPAALLPLLLITGITYLGTLLILLWSLRHFCKRWYLWLIFLAFGEFYLFLPGPICAPRYQIPALPVMCAFAGAVIVFAVKKFLIPKVSIGKSGKTVEINSVKGNNK